ncbi:MAG: sugar ABC transporter permease [Chloroflexi bacterium]|nr:sugar ABC transporter permease [Chloroflexota bacterium]MBU1748929.1 sugar ABC transporter permease [Chloroflexota bacterium]MBU1878457.1 sugar ABC transporter permease [Chloroflexota bacterium]
MSTSDSPRRPMRTSISGFLFRPVEWVLGLADLIILPIQNIIGTQRMAYFFILPNLLIFSVFILLPMLLNFYYGFTSGDSILLENRPFVGTSNLESLLYCTDYLDLNSCSRDLFWRSVSNTAGFVVGQVIAMVGISLITALVLNRKIVGRGFFRSVFFYPVLLSPVVVALIWKWILQHEYGLLNALIVNVGLEKIPFLLDANWARFWVIAVSVWAQMGFYTLILLAGLQGIPTTLYEAARMDGANAWQTLRSITLPLLMPTMTVVLVLSVIRAVQVFDQVYVLTNGGPGTATLYIVQYIYRTGFEHREYGMAAAASLVLAAALLVLTAGQLLLDRRQDVG